MGSEVVTRVQIGAEAAEAKALLETEEIVVRGALRARIPFAEMKDVGADGGVLRLRWGAREVRIDVGKDAPKWAEKIRNPKSVLDKLGVKAGQIVSVVGTLDDSLLGDLAKKGVEVSHRLRRGSDVIFFAAKRREDLPHLEELRKSLAPAGAVWVIRPKGTPAIGDADVMAAAKAAGLVDVKVARFSATHTAEKLVIPVASRSVKIP